MLPWKKGGSFIHSRKPFGDTKRMHTIGRRYTEERRRLHRRIVRSIVEKAGNHRSHPPIAILIGGGTASGKTTLRNGLVQRELKKRGIQSAIVDPDELKAHIPEYKGFQKTDPKRAASLVHRESCDIGALLLDGLIVERKSFVYEGTMARTKPYVRLVKRLRGAGFEIQVFVADVPLRKAKRRAAERARRTGRTVPTRVTGSADTGGHQGPCGRLSRVRYGEGAEINRFQELYGSRTICALLEERQREKETGKARLGGGFGR